MKLFCGVVLSVCCLAFVGCDSKEATSVVDGASTDAVAEYNRMLEESQAGYAEAEAAQEAAGIAEGGQVETEDE
ncbi:hypothetical protein N9N28_06285 [Rubripirellula amarantea]|uniref:Uncharacterized protein n=1 Tax=Rubripirellula amarantea TaxID=2527999 RepID=A0A5C5WW90_9BACT|nr:hypothetical protein [Rubripirellula amarantea]MDA8744225.1 hypothetical protein [Rubripirellula amarantea]TWT54253.1 hypothetical protein Pla22_18950 [Rubripirellula amarantea]